ncbi:MAG: DUF2795 domain-containing protein [Pseudonocardia sp.]|nr:DUF2795 domain-containing protein [Pseudonocardia sp.]
MAVTTGEADLDKAGIRDVLDGMEFPAKRWQLIAQAQYYGAPSACTRELSRLPAREYTSLRDVAAHVVAQR